MTEEVIGYVLNLTQEEAESLFGFLAVADPFSTEEEDMEWDNDVLNKVEGKLRTALGR